MKGMLLAKTEAQGPASGSHASCPACEATRLPTSSKAACRTAGDAGLSLHTYQHNWSQRMGVTFWGLLMSQQQQQQQQQQQHG